jgi:hypothetical protein
MRKISLALVSSLAMTAGFGSAWAQTPPPATPPAATPPAASPPAATPAPVQPAPAAPGAAPATAPAADPAPLPPAPPPADMPPAPEPAPAPAAAEEETYPAAWFRVDSDLAGVQLWAGATHMLSDTVGIATDVYLNAFNMFPVLLGELDVGPAFFAGDFIITPMLGLQVDWFAHRAAALVPQLFVVGGPDPVYMELWVQNYAYTVFDKSGTTAAGGANTLYTRLFVDYELGKYAAIGPQVEMLYSFNSKLQNLDGDSLISLPVGANVMLTNYGKNNALIVFAGYETVETPNDARLAGRLTFIHNF